MLSSKGVEGGNNIDCRFGKEEEENSNQPICEKVFPRQKNNWQICCALLFPQGNKNNHKNNNNKQ